MKTIGLLNDDIWRGTVKQKIGVGIGLELLFSRYLFFSLRLSKCTTPLHVTSHLPWNCYRSIDERSVFTTVQWQFVRRFMGGMRLQQVSYFCI